MPGQFVRADVTDAQAVGKVFQSGLSLFVYFAAGPRVDRSI
jgi:dTDP-D-glucose 4,6-dehydratase